ncbi:MAG: lipase maturation factor family protein [Bdellovibrionota bacterium]
MEIASPDYHLSRFVFQRLLAFLYLMGFLIAANQFRGLLGSRGLLPVSLFLKRVTFWDAPSLFWLNASDFALQAAAWFGVGLSLFALMGFSDLFSGWISVLTWGLLWLLYLSFVNVGQTFYGFGWEMLLLETGFLAIFLGPATAASPTIVIWLLRWVLFRIMFGAGMIKIRGDSCWRDLTCLQFHYETQPLPGPLSWYFHHLPLWFHRGGVLFNHFVELAVPFGFFGPRKLRIVAALLTILFQTTLILSGNLSWLNCITIVLCFACLDDRFLAPLLSGLAGWLPVAAAGAALPAAVFYLLAALVAALSIKPAMNLVSGAQLMNASFDPLHLVNTYGAFGSITRERDELILEGTADAAVSPSTKWKEFSFKGKPGDVFRRPPQVTPYHFKLDWQMWFAAMSPYYQHPWILNLVAKILQGEPEVIALMGENPFPLAPPHFVRILQYRYRFTNAGEKAWWTRELEGEYLPPLSLQDGAFRDVLERQGWLSGPGQSAAP